MKCLKVSILGPILFNIFLCDVFFTADNIDITSCWHTKFLLPACILENSNPQKLLGVTIDRKLNFNEHVTNLCDKASKKIQAPARISPCIPQTQKQLLMNAYFMSQFGYCPLACMNHDRPLNNRIIGLHKRALSLVYNDFSSSFQNF